MPKAHKHMQCTNKNHPLIGGYDRLSVPDTWRHHKTAGGQEAECLRHLRSRNNQSSPLSCPVHRSIWRLGQTAVKACDGNIN
jgi:hypothetical protein